MPDTFEYTKYITTTLFSVISAGFSFWALMLAKKITVGKTVKEKQLEVVMDLINHISKISFIIHSNKLEPIPSISISPPSFYLSGFENFHSKLFNNDDDKLFFASTIYWKFDFQRFYSNPLLPTKIRHYLDKVSSLSNLSEKRVDITDLHIRFNPFITLDILNGETGKNEIQTYFQSRNYFHLKDYKNEFNKLFDEINKWLKDNGASAICYKKS